MNKKYELTPDIRVFHNRTLHRIKALRDFSDIRKGDIGGYVESEANLSHEGRCWIYRTTANPEEDEWFYSDAMVWGNSQVYENAKIYEYARIYDSAKVYGDTWVSGDIKIFGNAQVSGNVSIHGEAHIYDDACIAGSCEVYGDARIHGDTQIVEINISTKNIKLDHGIWNRIVCVAGNRYLISTTLQKMLLE